jgi:hypothetical protein
MQRGLQRECDGRTELQKDSLTIDDIIATIMERELESMY